MIPQFLAAAAAAAALQPCCLMISVHGHQCCQLNMYWAVRVGGSVWTWWEPLLFLFGRWRKSRHWCWHLRTSVMMNIGLSMSSSASAVSIVCWLPPVDWRQHIRPQNVNHSNEARLSYTSDSDPSYILFHPGECSLWPLLQFCCQYHGAHYGKTGGRHPQNQRLITYCNTAALEED